MESLKSIALLLFVSLSPGAFCQTNEEQAASKGKEAIKLMDSGSVEESIKLLEEAQKLDPIRFDYPYELAYAHYLQKDFKNTIKILEKIEDHKDVSERLYQLLGNSYDMIGESDKAFRVYDQGLKKFPTSGIIYLEKGNVHWGKKEYDKALPYYEKGIEVDPGFSSNYYRATKIYCNSNDEVWGMIYGELFMNLERNSSRTAEISKLLFDTNKSQIKFTSDSSATVSFCQAVIVVNGTKKLSIPFCLIYEPTLLMSILSEKNITSRSLHRIRKNFVENYFNMKRDQSHPNILFEYQKKMLTEGHLEAYNHWIMMKGDEEEFTAWHLENGTIWDSFVKWFTANPLQLNNTSKFYRAQY